MQTKSATDYIIHVIEKTLTDDSKVYDVKICNILIPCFSQSDAIKMAEKFSEAINLHTVNTAGVAVY